jgi:hypothetical protein
MALVEVPAATARLEVEVDLVVDVVFVVDVVLDVMVDLVIEVDLEEVEVLEVTVVVVDVTFKPANETRYAGL